jgi:dihydrofolate synthase/folylpolyglutamate synthase
LGGLTLNQWLDFQENLHNKEVSLGLERIQKVYRILFPTGLSFPTILVAGTNGKGSTCAFIDYIYQQENIKTGRFSSPHITNYNERFRLNGKQATDAQIITAFERIEVARGEILLTYFEFSTLAALCIFTAQKVQIGILEVGLGGRLDCVNIVDANVCAITNIALDHIEYLGDTREKIGLEKAGIMRALVPCICSDAHPPKSLSQQAKKISALLEFEQTPYQGKLGLKGEHQKKNAALAKKVIEKLQNILPVGSESIQRGLEKTHLPARFETQTIQGKTLILDVAHNVAAAQVLAKELRKTPAPTLAIFCAMADKDISQIIDIMRPEINTWLLTSLNNPRAITLKNLSKIFNPDDEIKICKNTQDALKIAFKQTKYSKIVIFGSFYLVAEAIKATLRNK